MHQVRRQGDPKGHELVVKEPQTGSDELKILWFLRHLKASSPNVIELIETLQLTVGECLLLPFRLPYLWVISPLRRPHLLLARDLIQGVDFLHRHCIAHLDVKPDNLVLTSDKTLQLIDFSVAVHLESSDEQVEGYRGTEGWTAPEVGPLPYNPFKADAWSCGQVLTDFVKRHSKDDEGLAHFALRLMDVQPSKRPPLLDHTHSVPCSADWKATYNDT